MKWNADDQWSSNFYHSRVPSTEEITETKYEGGNLFEEIAYLKLKFQEMDTRNLYRKIITAIRDIHQIESLECIVTSAEERTILKHIRSMRAEYPLYLQSPSDKDMSSGEVEDSSELMYHKYAYLCEFLQTMSPNVLKHLQMRVKWTGSFQHGLISFLQSKIPHDISERVSYEQMDGVKYWWYEEIDD